MFFGRAMEWLFSDDTRFEQDLELSCAEKALESVANSLEMARYRREVHKRLSGEKKAA